MIVNEPEPESEPEEAGRGRGLGLVHGTRMVWRRMIYLDHNAITPVRPEAKEAVRLALEAFGNPSSVHRAGRDARDLLDLSRDRVANALGARPQDVVFTSGATEGAALAIRGALAAAQGGRRRLVVTAVEHPCVLSLARQLANGGTPLTVVPVDRDGQVDPAAFRAALGPDVALACAMRANNETGVILPVPELAAAAREAAVPFLCDAVQAVGKIPVDVRTLGADLVLATGQKLGGPRGAGVLWIAPGLRLAPLFGGEQERGRRAGTENLPGIAGLGAAIEAAATRRAEEAERIGALRDRLEAGLLAAVPRAFVNGGRVPRLPGTSSIVFEGCDAETLLIAMDLEGVCASAGSACHSGSTRPSGVLLAMGLSDAEARATIRFSLGWTSTGADVDAALAIVPPLVGRVRSEVTS